MPVSAIELVKKLMAKAGVTTTDPLTGDVPDDVATALDNQLLTIAAATNNHPDVKKVYFAQAYNGLDAEMKALVTEFGLTDDIVAEIEKAGGSTKKAAALARKLKEIGEKNAPADPTKAKELQNTITELNNKLAAEIKKQTDLEANYNKQLQGIKIKTKLQGMVGTRKTVYDELPPEAKDAAIEALLNKALQDSDADFTFDDKGNLSLIKKDGTNLFGENHTLVTPDSFIDKTLSKILKVTTPAANGGTIINPAQPINGSQNTKNAALDAAIAESLQNYTQGTKVAV
jgi:hypothetical protein